MSVIHRTNALKQAFVLLFALNRAKSLSMTPETLISIRKAEFQSLTEFAKRLGISRNTLAGYEKGKQDIPPYVAMSATLILRRMEAVE